MVERIEAEAVDAPVEPEAHGVQQRILHGAVVHVELGLAGEELVHIILPAARVPCPCGAAKDRLPVIGRRAIGLGVGPDIPVGLVTGLAGATVHEPVVQIGRVRVNLIDRDLEAQLMRPRHQRIEIG